MNWNESKCVDYCAQIFAYELETFEMRRSIRLRGYLVYNTVRMERQQLSLVCEEHVNIGNTNANAKYANLGNPYSDSVYAEKANMDGIGLPDIWIPTRLRTP